jgi:hypothetical protein
VYTPHEVPKPAPEVKRNWEWALIAVAPPSFSNPVFSYYESEAAARAAEREINPEMVTTVVSGARSAIRVSEGQRISAMRAAIQAIAGRQGWAYDARNRLAAEADDEPDEPEFVDLEYEDEMAEING